MFNTVAIVSAPARPSPGLTKSWGCSALFFSGAPWGSASGQVAGRALFRRPLEEAGAASNSSRRELPPLGPLAGLESPAVAASGIRPSRPSII